MSFNLIKDYKKDKQFYKNLFIITIPIILQNLITSSLNMLDTMMIGKIGEVELASVGIANQYYFLFSLFAMGISGGCGVLIAQLWGKNDTDNIKKVLAKSLSVSIIGSLVFLIIGIMIPQNIMAVFNKDASVIDIGSKYLRITVLSYLFTGISFTFASALRSVNNTKLPMFASLVGLIVNGVLNYILIFGKLGMPELKTEGAAIATLIARTCECGVILFNLYFKNSVLKTSFKDFIGLSSNLKKVLSSVTIPIVLNEACWGFGNVTYIAIYARISTKAAASMQICSTITNLFMIFSFGLGYATLVVVGNEIGANREDVAIESSKKISKLSVLIALFIGIILAISAKPIVSFFNVSNEVKLYSTYILYVYAIIMVAKVYNFIMIVGILRGGGDAAYGSILQGITLWFIGIPLAFIAAFVLHLPVYLVVSFTAVEEIIKFIFIRRRFKSFKWIRNMVNDHPDNVEFI
ncbi:MATE family efflux transporter [Tepidibacter hydrothermalis]|uniref:Probable multidrug resistance protein NorM n=1 Tax=Tepidibacter hydrothermalis TaxID=3036126 RepID=A0ABY8EH56_9FIRM|nr:MATE family efflux transporter [Tepidibacter hydrothermalis]WFD12276.1 MATE family efflux transporter [Tepidibacter hydrothermalis]